MASTRSMAFASVTVSALAAEATPAQGALDSAGAGITGGYTGDSLPLKIIIAFLLGLSLYNAIELIILIFVTFQRFHGLYFWSLVVATAGIIPYSLGFLIKFFQLLDPNRDEGYVAVVLLTIGWYPMVTGQSVVLWSRLHLLTPSRRVIRYTLYMIITNAILMHSTTTVLTFGSNSNSLSKPTLQHFVNGYSVMEKIQMVVFFLQEVILSIIYIREAVRLLKVSEVVRDDIASIDNGSSHAPSRNQNVRKTMYQLLAINVIIILMDLALLGVEFANLYLIETTLKGVVYSVKLKLEFAVLGKLVQIVHVRNASSDRSDQNGLEGRATSTGATLEKTETARTNRTRGTNNSNTRGDGSPFGQNVVHSMNGGRLPDFVDQQDASVDFTHARPSVDAEANGNTSWETRIAERRRIRSQGGSWIDEEMDKHNID